MIRWRQSDESDRTGLQHPHLYVALLMLVLPRLACLPTYVLLARLFMPPVEETAELGSSAPAESVQLS